MIKRSAVLLAAWLGVISAPLLHSAEGAAPNAGKAHEIPFKRESMSGDAQIAQVAAVTAGMLVLAVAAILLAKKYFSRSRPLSGTSHRRLTLLETMRLSQKTVVFLVEHDGETVLLAQSGDRVTVISRRPAAAGTDAPARAISAS